MSPVLKVDKDDEEKERSFELDYLLSLTVAERFRMMFERSALIKKMLREHGHRKTAAIIKRK